MDVAEIIAIGLLKRWGTTAAFPGTMRAAAVLQGLTAKQVLLVHIVRLAPR